MVKRIFKKLIGKVLRKPRKVARKRVGGRRLQGMSPNFQLGQPVRNVARAGGYIARKAARYASNKLFGRKATAYEARRNFNLRSQSDNITNAPTFKIGTYKKPSFEEKVHRVTNPPKILKRNYQWSAECESGRKGWFGIPINSMNNTNGTLYTDVYPNYGQLTSDTLTQDPTLLVTGDANVQKVYVDYLSEKLQMVNSSSNSITGTVSLFAYKRDCEGTYVNVNVPMTPINLMMFASSSAGLNAGAGNENTVGQGFEFDTSTNGLNYQSNYDMPGSSLNSGGATAQTDLSLKVMSSQIKEFTGYFFNEIKQFEFSLKPGQQINHYTIMNDLPIIHRQSIDMAYIRGISYYLVVQFQAGIVGDSTVTTGNNVISTGTGQLSCILEEKRIIGTLGKRVAQLKLITSNLTGIALASQYTINPDTGVADTGGADIDA